MVNDKNIAADLEKNIYDVYSTIARTSGRRHFESENLRWTDVSPSSWPNFIFDLNPGIGIEKITELILIEISEGHAPSSIFLGPSSYSKELEAALMQNGFNMVADYPGMIFDIGTFDSLEYKDQEIDFEVLNRREKLKIFTDIVEQGMFGKGFKGLGLLEALLDSDDFIFLLGSYKGKPVSTAMIFFDGYIAGIKLVTTKPGHRQKGFGRACMLFSMRKAKERGYNTAGLFASKMGENIYRELGFRQVCKFYKFE